MPSRTSSGLVSSDHSRSGAHFRASALACAFFMAFVAAPAEANEGRSYVPIGVTVGVSGRSGDPLRASFGFEVSAVHTLDPAPVLLGGLADVELVGSRLRAILGVEGALLLANIPFGLGLELGSAFEAGDASHVNTLSAHVGLFASLGFVSLGLRTTLPVAGLGPGRRLNPSLGLVLFLKYPLPADGGNLLYPKDG
jgi:hypothetical protein